MCVVILRGELSCRDVRLFSQGTYNMRIYLTFAFLGLIAGTASAAPQWSAEVVLSEGNDIAILQDDGVPGDNTYEIISLFGSFPTQVFDIPDGELYIRGGAGDDLIFIDGSILPTVNFSLFLFTGEGNDFAYVSGLNTTGNITSDDSYGNNILLAQDCGIAGNVAVFDGYGDQVVALFDSVIDGEVNVSSPDGAGTFVGIETQVGQSINLNNANYGDDYILLAGSSTGGALYADVGIGATTIDAIDSHVAGSLSALVQGGLLNLNLEDVGIGGSLFTFVGEGETNKYLADTIIGGIIDCDSFLGFDRSVFHNVTTSEIQLNNGEGGSITEVTGDVDTQRFVSYSGQGGDQVEFNGSGFINHVNIVHSDGNGRFESFGDITLGSVTYSSGGGLDIVTLDGTHVQGNLVAFLFNGATEGTFSNVTITDAYVGGMVDVNSTDGSDIVKLADSTFQSFVNISTGNGTDTAEVVNSSFTDLVLDLGFDFDTLYAFGNNITGIYYLNDVENILP